MWYLGLMVLQSCLHIQMHRLLPKNKDSRIIFSEGVLTSVVLHCCHDNETNLSLVVTALALKLPCMCMYSYIYLVDFKEVFESYSKFLMKKSKL